MLSNIFFSEKKIAEAKLQRKYSNKNYGERFEERKKNYKKGRLRERRGGRFGKKIMQEREERGEREIYYKN